jgi:hypothetical protein
MVIPRKWCRSPRSFIANSYWREEIIEVMGRCREDDVDDVKEKVDSIQATVKDEQAGFRLGLNKDL